MKTPEEIEAELKHLATKEDLHKELHAQTRQFVTWMGLGVALILGGVYFLWGDIKNDIREIHNDIREIRNRLPAQAK